MSHNDNIYEYFIHSENTTKRLWEKGTFLCREDGPLTMLHFLVSGKFRVFRTMGNGREIMYRIYTAGSVIGDIEFFTGETGASCSVQCIQNAVTLALPMKKTGKKPDANPRLIFLLGRGIARKLHENSVSEAINALYPLEVRLAHYYLTFTDPLLQAGTLGQLADWMGCSYRHLTRCLSDLKLRNAVRKTAGGNTGYEASDTSELKAIASPMLMEEHGRTLFEGNSSR